MQTLKAPMQINTQLTRPWLFIAGSIEMGAAENWQAGLTTALHEHQGTILNPRRDDWDSSWLQRASDQKFYQQVAWEQMAMSVADLVFVHFSDGTKSPITLMELGQVSVSRPESVIVRCTSAFWRMGNVEIVCQLAKVPINVHQTSEGALEDLKARLTLKRYGTMPVYDQVGVEPTATQETPMPEGQPTTPMPRYQCKKIVTALEIGGYEWIGVNTLRITPRDDTFAPITIGQEDHGRFTKISNDDTGYYVVYDSGYVSWSPFQVFRDGYCEFGNPLTITEAAAEAAA